MRENPYVKRSETTDLDLAPFLNLVVVLVPILLLSVEFAGISIVDASLAWWGSTSEHVIKKRIHKDEDKSLLLTAIVSDSTLILTSNRGILPSIGYREFHEYIAKEDGYKFVVEHKPGQVVTHPLTNRVMNKTERHEIYLYSVSKNKKLLNALYTRHNELVTNSKGDIIQSVKRGDTLYALSSPRRMIIALNNSEFQSKYLSAYDELKNSLQRIKERFKDVNDISDIIIAPESKVVYDKIVQIMDVAREAEFSKIRIAKLRES